MKKVLVVILSVLLSLALLAGCGGGSGNGGGSGSGPIQSWLDDYGDELQDAMDHAIAMGSEDISVVIEAGSGNEVVIIATISGEMEELMDADLLGQALSGQAFVFEMMADEIRDELDVDYVQVTVRYLDSGGSEIVSETFESQ